MMPDYEFELDEKELAPPKPYTPERQAEIDELNAEIAAAFKDLCEMG